MKLDQDMAKGQFFFSAQLWKINTDQNDKRLENKLHGLNWQYGSEILNTNPDKDKEGLVSFNVYDDGKKMSSPLGK